MTTIATESATDEVDGGCAPASKPINGAKKINAIAKAGKTIAVGGCWLVFAAIVWFEKEGLRLTVVLSCGNEVLKGIPPCLAGMGRDLQPARRYAVNLTLNALDFA